MQYLHVPVRETCESAVWSQFLPVLHPKILSAVPEKVPAVSNGDQSLLLGLEGECGTRCHLLQVQSSNLQQN